MNRIESELARAIRIAFFDCRREVFGDFEDFALNLVCFSLEARSLREKFVECKNPMSE